MIKYKNISEFILSENPSDQGVTATCFVKHRRNNNLLFAIVKDNNLNSLTLVIASASRCSSRTIVGKNVTLLREHFIEIYKNDNSRKLDKICPKIRNFSVVSSARFATPDLYYTLCEEIAKRLECTQVWIEDENSEHIQGLPNANFKYLKENKK